LVLLVGLLVGGRENRIDDRLQDLGDPGRAATGSRAVRKVVRSALPKVGAAILPSDNRERNRLKNRLLHAGLYGPHAMAAFLGAKVLLMVSPTAIGLVLGGLGIAPVNYGLIFGGCASVLGMIAPSFWLDKRKAARQTTVRRSLPDALDLLVICVEGGLSLAGALRRVVTELRTAHAVLAGEFNIVQREIQLGQTTGDALRAFADRSDLEEIRSLAAVVQQAEKYGASMIKTLRIHADTLRMKRQQRAEELAQKAGTKMLFPTLLFIFPAIFLVILGPAVIQIMQMMGGVKG
jgi:tight adherence protein C